MRALAIPLGLVLTSILFAFVACDSDDDSGGAIDDVSDIGQCPAANGAKPIDAKYPPSAVPNGGSCTPSTSCNLPVDDCANDWPPTTDRLSEYECDCVNGGWSCYLAVESQTPCPVDAGAADAATDDEDANEDADADASGDANADVDAGVDANAIVDASADADSGVDASAE